MILGALVGAGVPLQVISDAVDALGQPVTVSVRPAEGLSIDAQQVSVSEAAGSTSAGSTSAGSNNAGSNNAGSNNAGTRGLSEVVALINAAPLDDRVRSLATEVFRRLAAAESVVHGIPVNDLHFHEVGALDALADVVGAAAGFVHLDLEAVTVSPVALGSGSATSAHGELPVPVPAVLELLRGSALVTHGGSAPFEQCTPTGAAILATVASSSGALPPMSITSVGAGAGTRRLPDRPNVLRLVLGQPASHVVPDATEATTLVSTNVDDLDPRLWPEVLERLLAAGASDAWLTPILMKKGRPAHTLSVLCPPGASARLREIVFRETTALGVRVHAVDKVALERREEVVELHGGPVRVKLGLLHGLVVNAQPEYEDAVAVARETARPVKVVLTEALAALPVELRPSRGSE